MKTVLAIAMVLGVLAAPAPADIIYSNAEYATGDGPGLSSLIWSTTSEPYPSVDTVTVMVPFQTAGETTDPGWLLRTITVWGTLAENATATFTIWEDAPDDRPATVQIDIEGFPTWNAYDITRDHGLQSIEAWSVSAANTDVTTTGTSGPYSLANYTYTLDEPLELDADTIYWFSVEATSAANISWRFAQDSYDPAGLGSGVTGHMLELRSSVVPVPGAALLGFLGLAVAGLKLRKRV
jgi:hypothetical protein